MYNIKQTMFARVHIVLVFTYALISNLSNEEEEEEKKRIIHPTPMGPESYSSRKQ